MLLRVLRLRFMVTIEPGSGPHFDILSRSGGFHCDATCQRSGCYRFVTHCVLPWTQPYGQLSLCKSAVLPICPISLSRVLLQDLRTGKILIAYRLLQ